jgi:hypothetical protein
VWLICLVHKPFTPDALKVDTLQENALFGFKRSFQFPDPLLLHLLVVTLYSTKYSAYHDVTGVDVILFTKNSHVMYISFRNSHSTKISDIH